MAERTQTAERQTNIVTFRDSAGRVARLRALTGKGTTEVITEALEEKLVRSACHWCGKPATDGHRIVVRSEYVGGHGYVSEYCCDPDCRGGA